MADDQPEQDDASASDDGQSKSSAGGDNAGGGAAKPQGDGDKESAEKEKAARDKKAQDEKEEEERRKTRPFVRADLIVAILLMVAGGAYLWWTTRNVETTDDAYTEGRVITVAPHVSGYVIELDVNDNQFVHEGEVLARIDQRNYQATVDQDQGQLDQAESQLRGSEYSAQVAEKNFPAQLAQAKGQLLQSQGTEFQAQTDFRRQHAIARAATSQQAIDQSTASLEQAQGAVAVAEAQVEAATPVKANIQVSKLRTQTNSGALTVAQASLATAKLNLGWTVIRAPHDGWISQRSLEQGNYVNSGQALFSIVEPEVWITANFKETQLARMHAGQLADITVDAYPSLHLHGHLDSVQLGSGEQFSAFPPENATGNFVKIVQRVPVKILIDAGLDPNLPLPLGLSVEPTIHLDRSLAR